MKKTIYLEIDEEITSVVDKIKKTEEAEIFLVMPKGSTLLQSVINLKLLKKQAEKAKKDILIVTNDRLGKVIARQIGILVYNHIDKNGTPQGMSETADITVKEDDNEKDNETENAQTDDDDSPLVSAGGRSKDKEEIKKAYYSKEDEDDDMDADIELPKLSKKEIGENAAPEDEEETANKNDVKNGKEKINIGSHKMLWSILIGLPIVVAALVFIFLPRVEIVIALASEKLPIDTQFTVAKDVLRVDGKTKTVPGLFVSDNKEETKEFDSKGTKDVGTKAGGFINIYNEWDSDTVKLVKGTKVKSADQKVFLLASDVIVPGVKRQNGVDVPGQAEVKVEASDPGNSYNIGATTFTVVNLTPAEQKSIYGKSNAVMSGGSSKTVKIVSQDDFNKAKESFSKEITENYQKKIMDENKEYRLVKDAIVINIEEAASEPAVGSATEKFRLKLKVSYKAVAFKENDLKELLVQILEKEVSAEKEVHTSQIDSNKFVLASKIDKDTSEALFRFSADVDLIPSIDRDKLKKSLVFKNTKTIKDQINEYESVKSVDFKFWPFQMSNMPLISRNIVIKIEVQNENIRD